MFKALMGLVHDPCGTSMGVTLRTRGGHFFNLFSMLGHYSRDVSSQFQLFFL